MELDFGIHFSNGEVIALIVLRQKAGYADSTNRSTAKVSSALYRNPKLGGGASLEVVLGQILVLVLVLVLVWVRVWVQVRAGVLVLNRR